MPKGIYNRKKSKPRSLHTEATKKKIGKAHLGNRYNLGKERPLDVRKKISEANKGAKSHFWKGGICKLNEIERKSIEYRLWREAVFARDNWICQKYGIRGGKLHPHHIKNFAEYPELRFAIDNGITLSEKAHREFHKKYGLRNNTREQLEDWMPFQKDQQARLAK